MSWWGTLEVKFFLFTPKIGEDEPIQVLGWNHQLDIVQNFSIIKHPGEPS